MAMDYTILVSTCHLCQRHNFKLVLTLISSFPCVPAVCLDKMSLTKVMEVRVAVACHVSRVTFLNCTEVNRVQLFFCLRLSNKYMSTS